MNQFISPEPGDGRIDAHLHLWDLGVSDYSWLGPQHGDLYASWGADAAAAELAKAGVTGAVVVQAEDSRLDTEYLLSVAEATPWILGVVGWVQLDDPETAARQLEEWAGHSLFRGVRNLLDDDPRDDFLELPAVRSSLAQLAQRGLPFDVHNGWPRHLAAAADLAAALPELSVVIDHLGKPPRGGGDYDGWRSTLARVASADNTTAKVSGLAVPGRPFTVDALRETWQIALELFGPKRLMYGGDWPITVTSGGYAATWEVLSALIGELSADEQSAILGDTATRVYALERGRGRSRD